MASFAVVLLTVLLLVATSSAAPKNTKFSITIPEECKGKGFCSIRPEGYDEIEKMMDALLPQYLINLSSRSGDSSTTEVFNDTENCQYIRTEETMYTYLHPNSTKVDIIVQTKLLPQSLVQVICLNSVNQNGPHQKHRPQCFTELALEKYGLESSCRQAYATRSLLVYDPDAKSFRLQKYQVSVCCSCLIQEE